MSKIQKRIVIWSLLVLIIVVLILNKFLFNQNEAVTPEIALKGKLGLKEVPVNAILAKISDVNKSVFSNGTLLADESVELRPEISGKIISINFIESGRVRKGDLLVKLNDHDLIPQLKKAETRLKLLELTEQRQKLLLDKQGISKQDYDISLAELTGQRAELDYIKAMIEKTEIRAPFDGVVGLRNISEGAYITPANVITTLQKNEFLKIDFSVPQKFSNEIKKSKYLNFRVPPDTTLYTISILGIEPKVDEMTRTIKVRGKFNNSSYKLLPGSYAEVYLETESNNNTFMIPSIALIPDLESEFVYIYSQGKATKRNVKTGFRNVDMIEIVSGLNVGDTLITSGIMQLRPGIPVILKKIEG